MSLEWPLILFTFFVCLASGILMSQGVLAVQGKGKKVQLPALIAALIALVIGGISVFMHLQHWERIFNGFGHITSGITLEFIGCVVFFVVLVVNFLMMRRSEDGMPPKWCGVLGIIVGIAMPAVTGDSYLMESIPVWDTPMLPVYYVINAIFMGGLVMMVLSAVKKEDEAKETGVYMALVGGVLQLIAVIVYAVIINGLTPVYSDIVYYFDPTLPDVSMIDIPSFTESILAGSNAALFWLGVVIVGAIAPIVLAFMAKKDEANKNLALFGGAGLVCAVVGSFCWRAILYIVAVSIFALY